MSVSIERRQTAELHMPASRKLWVGAVIGVVIVALIALVAVLLSPSTALSPVTPM